MANNRPSSHSPSTIFDDLVALPWPLGRPLQKLPWQTRLTVLSGLQMVSVPCPLRLPLQNSPSQVYNQNSSKPLPYFSPALKYPSYLYLLLASTIVPFPSNRPLTNVPSQEDPSVHSNLPLPSFSPTWYSPRQVPLLFFSTPYPSGCSLLQPPLQLRLVTQFAQVPCVPVAPRKQLAFEQTKIAPLSSGYNFSLRVPSKYPWNSPFSRNLYTCTHPQGSSLERRGSVLAQMILQGFLTFQILLVLRGKLESLRIRSSTCLLSIGKADTSTRSRRMRLAWSSFPATRTSTPATRSSSYSNFDSGQMRSGPVQISAPILIISTQGFRLCKQSAVALLRQQDQTIDELRAKLHRLLLNRRVRNKIIGGLMKKRQAEEYFQQLKRIDKDRDIKLAELINILTGGAITVRQFYQFIDHLKGNEFGQYNHIDEHIDQKDWRLLDFPEVYELLKAIKDFILKNQTGVLKETPLALSRNSQLRSQALSQKDNGTVIGLLNGLSASLDPAAKQEGQQKRFQQKWKAYKLRVLKKLLIIFDFYRKAMCVSDQTFQHNSQLLQRFDLTMFMRYFKQFELSPAFELPRVLKLFKRNAVNSLWLDFDRFVDTHLQLVGCKEGISHQQRYLKLRGLNELLSPDKIKRMLNIRREHIATVVEGHTGAYKEDIIKHLQIKSQERKERISKKWSGKIKTERSAKQRLNLSKGKSSSLKSMRAKTQAGPSVYEQLKLPKLRVKQHRQESVYQSLNQLELSREQEKIRQLISVEEGEEYLQAYLKGEERLREKASSKPKLPPPLPRMKFT